MTIEGTLSGTGSANAPVAPSEEQFPYTAGFSDLGNPELTLANGSFVFNELGLALNTQYRVVAGKVASTAVVVSVSLGVTLQTRSVGTHRTLRSASAGRSRPRSRARGSPSSA